MINSGKVTVLIDGQWGSTGKGAVAAALYSRHPELLAGVCDFMPNAGHTFHDAEGRVHVSRTLPASAYWRRAALIGPHAAIDLELLKAEMADLRDCGLPARVVCHPLAVLVSHEDRMEEGRTLGYIASTTKGGHAASARKAMRRQDCKLARDHAVQLAAHSVEVRDTQEAVQKLLSVGSAVLAETSQGFDLGLNHGTAYPFVTGRDCLVGRVLDNAGASVRDCGSILGVIRTFPIRVGSTEEGSSGPHYPDQVELSWAEVGQAAGRDVTETTTVTKRTRRVFSFSWMQMRRFLTFVRPTHLALTHWDYFAGLPARERADFMGRLDACCSDHGCELRYVSTGPTPADVYDLRDRGVRELMIEGSKP